MGQNYKSDSFFKMLREWDEFLAKLIGKKITKQNFYSIRNELAQKVIEHEKRTNNA